jgi:hypothetical protein
MAAVKCPELPVLDNYIQALADLLDGCSDDLSPAGDGCDRCSCFRECCDLWESIEPERNNQLTPKEAIRLMREFQQIRARRQLRMRLTV